MSVQQALYIQRYLPNPKGEREVEETMSVVCVITCVEAGD